MIGGYSFVIMLAFLAIDLRFDLVTTLVSYAAASGLASSLIGLMCSSLALVCSFRFNLGMYSQVKLE